MKYQNFHPTKLQDIIDNPQDYSKDNYMLYVSYVIDNLQSLLLSDDEEEQIWGMKIPVKTIRKFLNHCLEDFIECGNSDEPIIIKGHSYSLRKFQSVNLRKLQDTFDFPTEDNMAVISKTGVFNTRYSASSSMEERKESYDGNRFLFWKVVLAAQTDEGWDSLSDMEIAVFMWGEMIRKLPFKTIVNSKMIRQWWEENYEYLAIPLKDIEECLDAEMCETHKLNTFFAFSADKVREWNETHGHSSVADKIGNMEAYDKWTQKLSSKYIRLVE